MSRPSPAQILVKVAILLLDRRDKHHSNLTTSDPAEPARVVDQKSRFPTGAGSKSVDLTSQCESMEITVPPHLQTVMCRRLVGILH